ncbi:uncharacterized protein EV154DRAFT_523436 [Mucor mucedo]|uniref:uncharacterized protein n=1 Tax=Mucor mucedo TaxID=29922 RepID=UPI0022210F2A|nr:uncharacterized protein EV154DRAFT_523436 [Mucor mucedo]KAI7881521.1 hypothetical protein EV154DRAFT_523436 [Mucor mucedo]
MSTCSSHITPAVTLNDEMLHDFPLTTEDPVAGAELQKEVERINKVDPEDNQVPTAIIFKKDEPNKIIPGSFSSGSDDDITVLDDEEEHPEIIVDSLDKKASSSPDDSDSDETDDELARITEANRFIPMDDHKKISEIKSAENDVLRRKSLRSQSVSIRRDLLVFSDSPIVTKKADRIIVHNHYGAGPEGRLEKDARPSRRSRGYLVACDFSEESFHSIEWTMGTMMRDGDRLYVVTAVNREDNPETVKQTGLSLSNELKKASDSVTDEAKRMMSQMLLFDVDLITYAISGRVKDVLCKLIDELPLTMVVCGSRGRGTVKGLLMGSISTYLVHKSSVPVSVIRPQNKKKAANKRPLHAAALSQSVKSGQLAVDELSKPSSEPTSGTETTAPVTTLPAKTK